MTAEGNVADTGIVEESKELIAEKKASNMPEALEILKQQAKRDKDKEKMEKIKRTQKAFGERHSRSSGKKKKAKR
ncbi:polymorphic toxin type 34 domain-containing protein [Microcoleus sp. F10-C6]|uniref:polymorphic toxin type 34 domain-containing protein n=1 Tax=unclassified Microcoleus TaxID=2642155 RepID=UPI002FCFD6E4